MSNILEVSVNRIDDKIKFEGIKGDNPPIIVDYPAPYGTGEGYTSLELLLISLCTCSSSSIVLLLKKMNKEIIDIKVKAIGERRTEHPTGFKTINLNFEIVSHDIINEDMDKAIKYSKDTLCPVWNMLKGNVEINCSYKVEGGR